MNFYSQRQTKSIEKLEDKNKMAIFDYPESVKKTL